MVDDLRHYKERDRAAKAQALVEDSILSEAFETLVSDFHHVWENSAFEETSKREDAYRMIQAVGAVRRYLFNVIETGKMADVIIEQEEKAENG